MLAELQSNFITTLKQRELTDFASELVSTEVSAAERMHIYANHLGLTLRELLTAAYPILAVQLGEAEFTRLCVSYCRQRPMEKPEAWHFGEGFAEAMQEDAALVSQIPLIDLARIERASQCCFYAAELTPLAADALAGLDVEALCKVRFELLPSVQLLDVDSQALGYWRQAQNIQLPAWLVLPEQRSKLLIQRLPSGEVGVIELAPAVFLFIELLAAGSDFITAYEEVLNHFADFSVQETYQYCLTADVFSNQSG